MSTKSKSIRSKPIKKNTSDSDVDDIDTIRIDTDKTKPTRPSKIPKPKAVSMDVLLRNMDIARSKVSVLLDSLDSNDNELILKRNVALASKHLSEIYNLLDH